MAQETKHDKQRISDLLPKGAIVLTEDQRKALVGILATHLHNMGTEASNAHGNRDKELFYLAAYARTEALIPLFAAPDVGKEDDLDSDDL